MNSFDRSVSRNRYGKDIPEDSGEKDKGEAITGAILEISHLDGEELNLGRIKTGFRLGAIVLGGLPLAGDIVTKVSDVLGFGIEQDGSIPNTYPAAVGAYVLSRLMRYAQNSIHGEASEKRDAFAEQHGDFALGAMSALSTDFANRGVLSHLD